MSPQRLRGTRYQTIDHSDRAPIERLSPMDLTVLATDRGSVPMNIGAALEFEPPWRSLNGRGASTPCRASASHPAATSAITPSPPWLWSSRLGRRRGLRLGPASYWA